MPTSEALLVTTEDQQAHFSIFYDRYVGVYSPWSETHVSSVLAHALEIVALERQLLHAASNTPGNQTGYGENFRPHTAAWITRLAESMCLSEDVLSGYTEHRRGITIDNVNARVLPTDDMHFYHNGLSGHGYPFDNLQLSVIWAGTPVYIIAKTQDLAWALVLTPDYIAWVECCGVAMTDVVFVDTWGLTANIMMVALTKTQCSMIDATGTFLFSAYVGSVFPATANALGLRVCVPVKNTDGKAVMSHALLSHEEAAVMPLPFTSSNVSYVFPILIVVSPFMK
jgi:hypothetical protein